MILAPDTFESAARVSVPPGCPPRSMWLIFDMRVNPNVREWNAPVNDMLSSQLFTKCGGYVGAYRFGMRELL